MLRRPRSRAVAALAATALAIPLMLTGSTSAHADIAFTSSGVASTGQPWLGFGTNEYPVNRDSSDNPIAWTSSALNLTKSRLGYMKPGLSRINVYREWFNPDGVVGDYNWNTTEMQDVFELLDYYKSQGWKVQIGIWHTLAGGKDDVSVYTSTSWATLQADLMKQLYISHGYTNIYGYGGINEWDCSWEVNATQAQYDTSVANLKSAFATAGLPSNLIVGPDTAGCVGNADATAAQNDGSILKAYEDHSYPNEQGLLNDTIESWQAPKIQNVDAVDFGNKPVYSGEVGVTNPDRGTVPAITSYAYGLDMFDLGVQTARSGTAGALAWCLDGFDMTKNCGMWDASGYNGGSTLRPWFYTWSLLSRYFPADASIYTMPEPANMRVVAALVPAGPGRVHWTFALVNRDTANAQDITLQVPGGGSGSFNEYEYAPNSQTVDSNGFPTAVRQISGGLAQGLTVNVPAGSAVLLTTLDGSAISQATGTSGFSSGFESADPGLSWTNTVDSSGGGISNVGGVCCGLTGPEAGIRTGEIEHAGSSALMFSGAGPSTASSKAYAYLKFRDLSTAPLGIGGGKTLSYWIYPQSSATTPYVPPGTNNSTCVAIDLIFTDGSALRNSGAVDQNGNRAHPAYQCGHLTLDTWNHVTVNLGTNNANKQISRILVGYDHPNSTGGYRGYIDDLSIS